MSVFHPFSCVLGSDHRGLANLGRRSQVSRAEEKFCFTAVSFCFVCAKFKIGSKRRHLKCAVESLSGGSRDGGASSLRRRITTGEGWLAKSEHFQRVSGIFFKLQPQKKSHLLGRRRRLIPFVHLQPWLLQGGNCVCK